MDPYFPQNEPKKILQCVINSYRYKFVENILFKGFWVTFHVSLSILSNKLGHNKIYGNDYFCKIDLQKRLQINTTNDEYAKMTSCY